jgi:transcriptional antiterminator RfaH
VHLAQGKPNSSRSAERNLACQEFTPFLPLERYTRKHGRNLVRATRSCFSGFIFVGSHTSSAHLRAFRSTPGMARLVCFGSKPATVPDGEVETLQQRCSADVCLELPADVAAGDEVWVTQGAFSDFTGRVARLAPKERALILIDLLGQQTSVSLPRAHLRRTAMPGRS